jgi:anti-sigma B factor antagonist
MLDDMFPVEMIEGVPVVVAPEEIDIANAEALRLALLKAAANGHGRLVVDMTQTRFCDLSGLHTLAAAHNRAQAEGREVLLVIPSPPVLRVFALTAMDRVIATFTTLTEALAQTGGRDDQLRVRRLRARMESMPVIEQAKGILMAQQRCGPDEAFTCYAGHPSVPTSKISVLAAQIVENVASPEGARSGSGRPGAKTESG